MKITTYLLPGLFAAILLMSFSTPLPVKNKRAITLQFHHLFNNEPLLTGKEYTNAHGEKLTVKTFKYFISNIRFKLKNGSIYTVPQDSSYFLISQDDTASQTIQITDLPNGRYTSVSFMIGIDSTRNTLDVSKRTGSLDIAGTAKGMYWAWNSGYIFLKFEGKSPVIPDSLANNFYYHIGGFGGFKSPTINNIRTKSFEFVKPVSVKKHVPVININVDIASLFKYKKDILLARNSNVMWGELSVNISENYLSGFTMGSID
jgi:hypothetical protein